MTQEKWRYSIEELYKLSPYSIITGGHPGCTNDLNCSYCRKVVENDILEQKLPLLSAEIDRFVKASAEVEPEKIPKWRYITEPFESTCHVK